MECINFKLSERKKKNIEVPCPQNNHVISVSPILHHLFLAGVLCHFTRCYVPCSQRQVWTYFQEVPVSLVKNTKGLLTMVNAIFCWMYDRHITSKLLQFLNLWTFRSPSWRRSFRYSRPRWRKRRTLLPQTNRLPFMLFAEEAMTRK